LNYLSLVLFLPLLGAFLLAVVPGGAKAHRNFALGVSGATFLLSLRLWFDFDVHANGMQFVERFNWIQSLGIRYAIGVDGLSLMLILLTTFLSTIAILASFNSITERTRSYYACLLALETGMLGVFMAFDLFFFYVFWEVMLIPMALLIGIWGGKRRVYAAIKFFLYTMAGSVLMLVAIIATVLIHRQATGTLTFDLFQLYSGTIAKTAQMWLFAAFALAFALGLAFSRSLALGGLLGIAWGRGGFTSGFSRTGREFRRRFASGLGCRFAQGRQRLGRTFEIFPGLLRGLGLRRGIRRRRGVVERVERVAFRLRQVVDRLRQVFRARATGSGGGIP